MSAQKSEIKLSVNGKDIKAYLAQPSNGGPGVLLLHAGWGFKPFFKRACDQVAEQGFTVLVPDMFDGQIAKTIDEAKELAKNSKDEVVSDIMMAAKDHLLSLTKNKIAVLGFYFGADWAIETMNKEPGVAATVLFGGAYGPDFSNTKAKVLGHFSDNDELEPIEGAREMEANMKAAGIDVTIYVHPGVAHWFMESDRPEYDPKSAKLAWDRTFEFLNPSLREEV